MKGFIKGAFEWLVDPSVLMVLAVLQGVVFLSLLWTPAFSKVFVFERILLSVLSGLTVFDSFMDALAWLFYVNSRPYLTAFAMMLSGVIDSFVAFHMQWHLFWIPFFPKLLFGMWLVYKSSHQVAPI